VLVEGFPGSGKSTTAQWLALAWRRQGVACWWIYEQQPDHPVSRALGPGGYGTWDEWAEERLGLLRRDVPPPAIVTFVARIAGAVRALDPRLAYLRVADPDTAFRALVARRGAATLDAVVPGFLGLDFAERTRLRGLDLLLAYWRAHYEVLRAPRGRRARPRRAAVASQPPVYGRAATPPEPPRGVSLSTLTYRGWSSRLCASIWRRRLRCRIH